MKKIKLALFLSLALLYTSSYAQQNLSLVYQWFDSTIVGSNFYNNAYNEVWGFVQNNREYAVIGTTQGTHIFDVSDQSSIYKAQFIQGAVTGGQIIHRDYHDYNGYLYMVSDEGPSTLQIADLRSLPDSAPVVYDSNTLFFRAHNIFIDTANAIMYTCGGNTAFSLYSLADPTNPTLLLNCQIDVPFWNQIGYVHDAYVVDNVAYLHAEGRGLFVVDFSDLSNPTVLGSITTYPDKGYNHSGWLSEDKTIYAMADETWGMDVKILDVSDLSDIKVLSTVNSGVDENFSIAHNLIIKDNYLFISYYYDGVYIYDISDPSNPILVDSYDTSPLDPANSYKGCWGVYPFLPSGLLLASDMQEGLFVFDASTYVGIDNSRKRAEKNSLFTLYPNPTNGMVRVELLTNEIEANYSIVDLNGKVVKTGALSGYDQHIETTDLSTGLYMVKVQQQDAFQIEKLMIR